MITKKSIEQQLGKEITYFLKHSQPSDLSFSIPARGSISFEDFLSNKMLIIFAIHTGIPYPLFDTIQHYTPFSESNWSSFLDISTKSLHRYRQSSKSFGPLQSEKIIEMAEVTKTGLDVFGEMDKFKLWLNTPSYALGNIKPIELLKDSYGKELVISELTRINHGIFV